MADPTTDKELKNTLAAIEKEFGKGAIMQMGEMAVQDVQGISTGSLSLDVALGGITWRADREITAPMSRALASFGPCLVGDAAGQRLAVNRGGFLEGWARARYADREISAVDEYDYVVINDDLARCVLELQGIILAERARRHRREHTIAPIVKTFE